MAFKLFQHTSFALLASISAFLFSNAWAETEPYGNDCASAVVLELNSTNLCQSVSGTVGNGNVFDADIFKIYMPDADNNLTFNITNESGNSKLEYAYLTTCSDSPSTTAIGNSDTASGTENNIGSGSYRYIYLTGGSNNAETPYTLDLSLPGCSGGGGIVNLSDFEAHVDVVDESFPVTTSAPYQPWIKTKVSKKSGYVMKAVYLGTGENATGLPQPYLDPSNKNNPASITILLKLGDFSNGGTCETVSPINLTTSPGNNTPVVMYINVDQVSASSNSFVMAYAPDGITPLAKQNVRFMYKAIDFNQLILNSGIQCVKRSSTGGVVEGIPACMIAQPNETSDQQNTAIDNYITVFGQTAYENCYTDNGEPCAASNGGVGAPPYDHPYGCFECSIGNMPYTCSQDNFAIRPDHFAITTTNPHYPDLLRSGADHNMTVYAYDYGITSGTTGSQGYNQLGGDDGNLTLDQGLYLKTGVLDTGGLLHGTLDWSAWDFNMSNGQSTRNGMASSEVAGVVFDDVGQVNIGVEDRKWAQVDIDHGDTATDCSSDGAYICGDQNVTYIPDHFRFVDTNITNNNGMPGTFTYIANLDPADQSTFAMGGRVNTLLQAENANDGITQNFRSGAEYYENPVAITQVVHDSVHGDANTTTIAEQLLGFGTNGDANGTKLLKWDETNLAMVLRFNFPREVNVPVNPFVVDKPDYNATAVSHYTNDPTYGAMAGYDSDAYPEGVEDNASGGALFLYGRVHAPRYRVECTGTGTCSTATSPNQPLILYDEFYYDATSTIDTNTTLTTTNALSSGTFRSVDSINWYTNRQHTQTDGNVSSVQQYYGNAPMASSPITVTGPTTITSGTSTINTTYSGASGYPYKATMGISASTWLIYNRFDATSDHNEFELEFNAAQLGGVTTSSDKNITSPNTSRRIRW